MAIRFSLLLLLSLTLVPLAAAQAATSYALVVGVSNYPNLGKEYQLNGPKYDAEMVRDFLASQKMRNFPKSNITILADGVVGGGTPTRQSILTAMDNLAAKATTGDFIYLHFSGHGSRQPGKRGDNSETDGLDELFLPADIGKWDNDIGTVQNALVDDEIGQRITAIRAKGAFVWAVFDSCHSGTVSRGAPVAADMKERKVSEEALGIPQEAMDRAESNAAKSRGLGDGLGDRESALADNAASRSGLGGFVAFYAAQTTQTTPEMMLPRGAEGRKPHGLFSFTMLQAITEHPGITYQQAAQEILQRYSAQNLDRPTPLFEGDLGARIFGSEAAGDISQWPVTQKDKKWFVAAGSLNRIAAGSIVALLASPSDSSDKALGYAEVVEVQSMESALKPIAFKTKKASDLNQMPDHAYARLVQRKLDFTIRVAKPAKGVVAKGVAGSKLNQSADDLQRVAKMVAALVPDPESGLRISWVEPGGEADIRLVVANGQLWFLPPTGELILDGASKTPSIGLNKDANALKVAVVENMARTARVVNLLRVSQGMVAGSSANVAVQLTVDRAKGGTVVISGESVPEMYPGDTVYITAKNSSGKPIDLNLLFIGSDYSITPIFSGRVHPGDGLKRKGLFRVTDKSLGRERLLVIANQAKPESMVLDLSFLQQSSLPKSRGQGQAGLGGLLRDAGFGTATSRGIEPLDSAEEGSTATILQFSMDTKPAP